MKVGDSIKIKTGNIDPDTGIKLDGFMGRIKEYLASNLVNIEWDSISLQKLPDSYIRSAINDGCEYAAYNIGLEDIELYQARDKPADVLKTLRQLGEKWDNLELYGDLAEVMEEIEEQGWDNYITEQINFPFKATYYGEFRGIRDTDIITVQGVYSEDDMYGVLMRCKFKGRSFHLPLCEMDVEEDEVEEVTNVVELYKEYFQ